MAIMLLFALQSGLGKYVGKLEGIVDFIWYLGTLDEPSFNLPFKLEAYTPALSLYLAFLQACPHLTYVEIQFNSQNCGKFLQALAPSSASLKVVRFKNPALSDVFGYRLYANVVKMVLQDEALAGVDNIFLDDVDDHGGLPDVPSTQQALKTFCFGGQDFAPRLSEVRPFLPINSASLETIYIQMNWSVLDLNWILQYLPSTIRSIGLDSSKLETSFRRSSTLGTYLLQRFSSIPVTPFGRFKSLQSLAFLRFDGPTLGLLETLANTAPQLSELHFENCTWIRSSASTVPIGLAPQGAITGIVDPEDLEEQLVKFGKLRKVHLGILPTITRETYSNLEELKEAKSMVVQWEICKLSESS